MRTCFVIQPFDNGPFDERFDEVIEPAIRAAGLEPYRVDRDPAVSVPIDNIESEIRRSALCLAEITTDNPNVWFELGFAIAASKEVVLVCAADRGSRFPFDVQHRHVIRYERQSPKDFTDLAQRITDRTQAILQKERTMGALATDSPMRETEGLSQHEIVALASVMQNSFASVGAVSGWAIAQDMDRAGFTDLATSLALRLLQDKGMVVMDSADDYQGETYYIYQTTGKGAQWLLANQAMLALKRETSSSPVLQDEEVPF